jgi:hypothetical protein
MIRLRDSDKPMVLPVILKPLSIIALILKTSLNSSSVGVTVRLHVLPLSCQEGCPIYAVPTCHG